jgi:hypothetical protein
MNMRKLCCAVALILFGSVLSCTCARANYYVVPSAESYTIIVDSWKLTRSSPGGDIDRLEVVYKGKAHNWPIDRFLLADRTNSDSICTGTDERFTRGYLEQLNTTKPKEIRVEVVAPKKGDPLKVAGVWSVDFKQSWERAIKWGSRVLNLSAWEVRVLKTPKHYERKLREFSDQQWLLVGDR